MFRRAGFATAVALAAALLAGPASFAADEKTEVRNVDDIVRSNPLVPGGETSTIVETIRAGSAEISILIMSRNRLHHHEAQDHVLYLVRGSGTARLENADGKVEAHPIKPGDILSLPRGRKHGFAKTGNEDLVFLVVATPFPHGVEETTFHE
jgi:mannose-6-phosphate isomerase-like protein (cupin superfamily)